MSETSSLSPPVAKPTKRIPWLDALRVAACFMVIVVHACDPYNLLAPPGEAPVWGAFYGSLLRPCVPLFVMIAGVLLIPVTMPTGEFLKRRFSRVLAPFLAWSVLYSVVPAIVGHNVGLEKTPYGMSEMWDALLRIPVNFYGTIWHLWYLYTLLGLYLILPVVSPWIRAASKRELQGFLGIWGVTLFLPYVKLFYPMIHGAAEWNDQELLTPFTGYLGCMILAHYLVKYLPDWTMTRRLAIGGAMFAVGFAVTWIGFRHTFLYQDKPELLFGGFLKEHAAPAALKIPPAVLIERFWWYLSINVMLMTTGVFIVFMGLKIRSERVQAVLSELSQKSFGVFLIHLFFVYNMHRVLAPADLPAWLGIPLNATITFAISYAAIKAISYLPKSRWLIG